jgi:hypothetical protein
MMGTETVPETLDFNELTRLSAREEFINFSRRESFTSYILISVFVEIYNANCWETMESIVGKQLHPLLGNNRNHWWARIKTTAEPKWKH